MKIPLNGLRAFDQHIDVAEPIFRLRVAAVVRRLASGVTTAATSKPSHAQ